MKIRRLFSVPVYTTFPDVALLLIRVVAGLAFMLHGWGKIQNPFGWMGPDAFAPGVFQALAAVSEFGGGLAWVLGLLTPLAALGIASTMSVEFYVHATVYFCIAVLLIALGPGRLSLDRALFGSRN